MTRLLCTLTLTFQPSIIIVGKPTNQNKRNLKINEKEKVNIMIYLQLTDEQYIWIQEIIDNALNECENENTSYAFKAGYLQSAIETIQHIIQDKPEE